MDAVSPDVVTSRTAAEETETIANNSPSTRAANAPPKTLVDAVATLSLSTSSCIDPIAAPPPLPPPPPSPTDVNGATRGAAANDVVVKCAMVGDLRVGKTTLMVK